MNRSLRSTLNKHLLRAFASLTLSLITICAYSQIMNCPASFVSIVVDDDATCTAGFMATPAITTGMGATFTSTGATEVMTATSIDMLSGFAFSYGVSEVTITDGGETCVFPVIVTDVAPSLATLCDDITIDLAGECMQEFNLPTPITLPATGVCPAGTITFSYDGMDPMATTFTAEADDLGLFPLTIFISNGMQQGECATSIEVVDSAPIVPSITCPGDATLGVAPSCEYLYRFDVEAVLPCNGALVQAAGPASGTSLAPGSYTFTFNVNDSGGATVETCTWTITVEENAEAGAQVNCLGELNISLDQTCEATVDPTTFIVGQVCNDISLFTVSATLPTGEEISGASIVFTEQQLGQEIEVNVFDPNGINSCWGIINIEDKLAPVIMCPDDIEVTCLESTDTSMTGIPMLIVSPIIVNDGGDGLQDFELATISNGSCTAELFFDDVVIENGCDGDFQRVILRTFYVIDMAGNRSESCTQTISVTRETLASATYPEHFDGLEVHTGINDNGVGSNPPLACDGQDTEWNSLITEEGRIIPSPFDSITMAGDTIFGTGAPGGVGTCGTIKFFFEDLIIDICEEECSNFNPSFKVLRTFDIYDWCTGETRLHEQIIKVVDSVPPVFSIGVPDLTISTDLWGCGATIELPQVLAEDNCATDITYSWFIQNGTYDAVLNRVYVPEVALTEVGEEIPLIAFAEDCCGNIVADTGFVTIIDDVLPVIVADEHTVVSLNNLEDDGSTKVHVETFDDGSWDNCSPIDWWIRRMDNACPMYDGLDENGNPDTTEIDEVNDFHKEIHFCCRDVGEEQRVIFMVCDDADRDGTPEMNGDDNCSTAMILVDVQDKLAPTIVCPRPVTINCIEFALYEDFMGGDLTAEQEDILNVRFDTASTTTACVVVTGQTFSGDEFCGSGTATRTFTATNSNGDASCDQIISVIAEDENILTCSRISFPTLSEAPFNYNWCDPADQVAPFVTPVVIRECGDVVIEEPVIDRDDLCTEVGINVTLDTFSFAGGGCLKILAHWEVVDQCIFDENYLDDKGDTDPTNDEVDPFVTENGYYEIYIEYDIFDEEPPVVLCDDVTVETGDCVANYGEFTFSASDDCTPTEALGYAYRVDLNADGTYDYPADSSSASGNTFDANLVGGLPIGRHNIKWVALDGCGNFAVCVQEIIVVQRIKAPTPYCHLGLSTAAMDEQFGCAVEMWAIDFVPDQTMGACGEDVTYLMIPYQDIFKDPADPNDDLDADMALELAQDSWEFGCQYIENGVQHVVEIRIYAVDANGVYDFCDASLTINDNFDCCPDQLGNSTLISGNVMTESGIVMEDIEIEINGNAPELPKKIFSNETGSFVFNNLIYDETYRVSAWKNEDALDGVSTLDLVLIQRHILGMTELDTPYKIIAADINGNEVISATDLLQLRKLILGLYDDDLFPNNLSWRFLDDSYNFVIPTKPFPFNEVIHVKDLGQAMYNQNFVAVKTGDVNNSVAASLQPGATRRENRNYSLNVDNAIFNKGEFISVPVVASRTMSMVGMQFALDFDEALVSSMSIEGENLTLAQNNVVIKNGLVRVSWNELEAVKVNEGDILFNITFSAEKSSRLTNVLRLDAKTMNAELYNDKLETEDLTLAFRTVEGASFEMLQNEPNPFSNRTKISFNLPEAGDVTFKVYDLAGKVLMDKSAAYSRGFNTLELGAEDLNAEGVLYYQIEFGGEQITKKMILLE